MLNLWKSNQKVNNLAYSHEATLAKLTAAARKKISGKNFALPGRRYPIEDKNHAKAALSRVSQFGTPAEKATVRAKVAKKYPGLVQTKMGMRPR